MSSSSSSSLGASIPQALVSGDVTLVRVKASVGMAVVVFVCLVLFPASFLAVAARRSAVVGLLLVACQTVLVGIFLYFNLARGVSFLLLLETLHLFVLQGVATEAVAPHVTWQ